MDALCQGIEQVWIIVWSCIHNSWSHDCITCHFTNILRKSPSSWPPDLPQASSQCTCPSYTPGHPSATPGLQSPWQRVDTLATPHHQDSVPTPGLQAPVGALRSLRFFYRLASHRTIPSIINLRDMSADGLDGMGWVNGSGCWQCWELGPPPDTILTIPPPPLPAFLQLMVQQPPPAHTPDNQSSLAAGPCSPPCHWTNAQGVEFVELPRQARSPSSVVSNCRRIMEQLRLRIHSPLMMASMCQNIFGNDSKQETMERGSASVDDTWLLVLISCSVGVLLLGSLLALLLLKCREDRGGKAPIEGDSKQRCEAVLYPSGGGEPAALWATLTPRGTTTHQLLCNHAQGHNHHNSGRLFENSAFIEPEECCLRPRHQQLLVSSPTRIENPNLPPLNLHRSLRRPPADHTPAL